MFDLTVLALFRERVVRVGFMLCIYIYLYTIVWKKIYILPFLILYRALSRPFSGILSQAPLLFEPFLDLSPLGFSFIDPSPKLVR